MQIAALCLYLAAVSTASQPSWPAPRDLGPQHLLLVANRAMAHSAPLAHYYASVRGVSAEQILVLDLPTAEDLSRADYERKLAGPVKQFLRQRDLEDRIRCVVLFYGVPLRVGAAKPTPRQRRLAQELQGDYRRRVRELERLLQHMVDATRQTARQPLPRVSTTLPASLNRLPQITQRVSAVYRQAAAVIKAVQDPLEKRILLNRLLKAKLKIEGASGVMGAASRPADPAAATAFDRQANQLERLQRQIRRLRRKAPDSVGYGRVYDLIEQVGGVMGLLDAYQQDIEKLQQKDSLASVDSELSMLLADDYPLAGRIPNTLNPRLTDTGEGKVLMVCRLDGPSRAVVAGLIDQADRIERTGLTGKVYLDARGLTDKDGKFVYDENLRALARFLRRSDIDFPVILDDNAALFQFGQCPDAAIYCGWYSLRRYVDAFGFVPGAVGYHIASFEAETLRKATSNVWCKRMLEEGAAATLGAVAEPFLDAFPLPGEFFGLLLTGRYTLVECFYLTKRYNSWRMTLIGDPLYRPFKTNPQLKVDQVEMLSYSGRTTTRPAARQAR